MGERDGGVRTLDGELHTGTEYRLSEIDVLKGEHDLIGEVMEWAYTDVEGVGGEGQSGDALQYLFGVYDMVEKLMRMAGWNTTG